MVYLRDGGRYPLRTGVNALGRAGENDLILPKHSISRRHCVVLVHATGGCEVYDTASRNGTFLNGRRVGRTEFVPGDVLALCDLRFALVWVGPGGDVVPAAEAPETSLSGQMSPTG